jgi:hypothetical protein
MSVSHTPRKLAAHRITLTETLIFAGGLLVAMLVGVAASGVLPV